MWQYACARWLTGTVIVQEEPGVQTRTLPLWMEAGDI
jgi:hypothetical protein